MDIQFIIQLPKHNLQRVGIGNIPSGIRPVDSGLVVDRGGDLRDLSRDTPFGRSRRGFKGRELHRFFPVMLLLESLCKINQWQLRVYGYKLPRLYDSGIRYKAELPGKEEWPDIPSLLKQGWGDCEDLACARTAEIREYDGLAAVPCIKFKDFKVDGSIITLIHVMVLLPSGQLEDPSKRLGMEGDYQ